MAVLGLLFYLAESSKELKTNQIEVKVRSHRGQIFYILVVSQD